MKELVIFDLDGTLLNTIADLACATNQALEALGFPTHPQKAYYRFVGDGINKLFERALPACARGEENVLRVRERFVPYYDAHNADKTRPYDGIENLLGILQLRGVKLAVASNKYQAAAEKLVQKFFPDISFVCVCGQCSGRPAKPDPQIVQDVLRAAGVSNEKTLYVGDSDVDMQTARNASVKVCAVWWGFRPPEELAAYAPEYMAQTPADILQMLD